MLDVMPQPARHVISTCETHCALISYLGPLVVKYGLSILETCPKLLIVRLLLVQFRCICPMRGLTSPSLIRTLLKAPPYLDQVH